MTGSLKRIGMLCLCVMLLGIVYVQAQDEGDVLFEDDFESSKELRDWEWSEDDHDFARVATDGEDRVLRLIGGDEGVGLYSDDDDDWENYALELRFKIITPTDGDGYDFVMVLRDDLENNASAGAIFASQNEEVVIATSSRDDYQEFDTVDFEFEIEEWYDARFAVAGERLELSINGEVVAEAESDEQGERGGIGLIVGDNTVVLFDDVRVTALEVENQIVAEFGDEIGALLDDDNNNDDDEPEVAATAEVVVNTANLRAGPGTGFAVVGQAQLGDTFEIIGQTGEGEDVWYLIDEDTWIFSGTVQIEPEDADIPTVEP